jgi:hypothetical protein
MTTFSPYSSSTDTRILYYVWSILADFKVALNLKIISPGFHKFGWSTIDVLFLGSNLVVTTDKAWPYNWYVKNLLKWWMSIWPDPSLLRVFYNYDGKNPTSSQFCPDAWALTEPTIQLVIMSKPSNKNVNLVLLNDKEFNLKACFREGLNSDLDLEYSLSWTEREAPLISGDIWFKPFI